MGEAMADQDIFHTAELVKAAIPFVDNRTQGMADLFVKVCDLMGSVKSAKKPQNLAACGFAFENIDIEGLLAAVRPVCNKKERDIVDRILNLFHMKKMFEMYTNMMEAMKTMQDFGGFPFGDMNQDDTSNVTGNFTGSNFESIFQTIKAFTAQSTDDNGNTVSKQSTDDVNKADIDDIDTTDMEEDSRADLENGAGTKSDHIFDSDAGYGYGTDSYYGTGEDNGYDNRNDMNEEKSADGETIPAMDPTVADILRDIKAAAAEESISNNIKIPSSNTGSGTNSTPMLDMLKSMVPSDKKGTFENLSMLFNSMSYDNNSKTDDQKGE
jgi:hypothetical protein